METSEETGAQHASDLPPEQLADLRRLQLAADEPNAELQALEDAETAQAAAAQAQQVNQNSKSVRMMLDVGIPFLSKMYPSLAEVYSDEARMAVAVTVGPVLTKYGIDLGDVGGRYKEEIAMVMVCGPIAFATYEGIKTDIAARAKPAPKALASTPQQPAQAAEPVKLG